MEGFEYSSEKPTLDSMLVIAAQAIVAIYNPETGDKDFETVLLENAIQANKQSPKHIRIVKPVLKYDETKN